MNGMPGNDFQTICRSGKARCSVQLLLPTSRLPSYCILDCILSFFPYVPIFLRQLPTTKKHYLGVQNGGGGGDMSSEGAEEQRREVFTAPRSSNFGRAFMHALFYDAPSVGQVAYGAHLRCKAPNPNHTKPRDRQSNKFTDIHSHPLIL